MRKRLGEILILQALAACDLRVEDEAKHDSEDHVSGDDEGEADSDSEDDPVPTGARCGEQPMVEVDPLEEIAGMSSEERISSLVRSYKIRAEWPDGSTEEGRLHLAWHPDTPIFYNGVEVDECDLFPAISFAFVSSFEFSEATDWNLPFESDEYEAAITFENDWAHLFASKTFTFDELPSQIQTQAPDCEPGYLTFTVAVLSDGKVQGGMKWYLGSNSIECNDKGFAIHFEG